VAKIENIRVVGQTMAYVHATVDGVACDATYDRDEPVVRATAHPSPVVMRGADVPAEIVDALNEARALARSVGVTDEERRTPPPGLVARSPEQLDVLPDPHFLNRGIG
jgi:hypothetical protein